MNRIENPAIMLMKNFCKAYNDRNLESVLSLFCKEHEVHCFGTGIDEDRHGLKEMEKQVIRDWEQSEQSSIIPPKEFYCCEDPICWAAGDFKAEITVSGKSILVPHLRVSIYAIQETEGWKISHMHCSFPSENQAEGNSFPST